MKIRHIALAALATLASATAAHSATMTVMKSASCGCCAKWIEHVRQHGFAVKVVNVEDMAAVKSRHGVPRAALSCHTATVDGYVVEGHVPAADIRRLLKEKPAAKGIAVAGMPMGSPGWSMATTASPLPPC